MKEKERLKRESSIKEQVSHANLFPSFMLRSKRTTRITPFKHITVVMVTFALVNPTSHVEDVKKNQRVGQKRACSDNDEEKGGPENRTKKNKEEKTMTCVLPEDPTPEPQLPGNFMTRIKGLNRSEIALVVPKKLFASNVSKSQCHILMSYTQMRRHGFLTTEERQFEEKPAERGARKSRL